MLETSNEELGGLEGLLMSGELQEAAGRGRLCFGELRFQETSGIQILIPETHSGLPQRTRLGNLLEVMEAARGAYVIRPCQSASVSSSWIHSPNWLKDRHIAHIVGPDSTPGFQDFY